MIKKRVAFFIGFIALVFFFTFTSPVLAIPPGTKELPRIPFAMLDCGGGYCGSRDWSVLYPEWGPVGSWWDFNISSCCGGPASYIIRARDDMTVILDDGRQIPKPVGIGLIAPRHTDLNAAENHIRDLANQYNDNSDYPNLAFLVIGCRAQQYGECSSGDELIIDNVLPIYRKYFTKLPTFVQCTQHNCGHIAHQYANDQYSYKNAGVKCNGWFMNEPNACVWVDNQLSGGCMGFAELYHEQIPVGFEPKFMWGHCESYIALMEALSHHPDFLDIQAANMASMYQFEDTYKFPLFQFTRDHLQQTIENTPDVWTVLRKSPFMGICASGKTCSSSRPCQDGSVCQYARCVPAPYGEAPDSSCPPGQWKASRFCDQNTCSGPWQGNYNSWLYPREDLPGSKPVVKFASHHPNDPNFPCAWEVKSIPFPASAHPYSRYSVKKTDQANGNPYMSFDIDNRFVNANSQTKTWEIEVTFVNQGTDKLSLEYKKSSGQLVKQTLQKGIALNADKINDWTSYNFRLTDVLFDDNLDGQTGIDFRIDSRDENGLNDGDEIIHRVMVKVYGERKGVGNLDNDPEGLINEIDLSILLNQWGTEGGDLNDDATTDQTDLAILLSYWTP